MTRVPQVPPGTVFGSALMVALVAGLSACSGVSGSPAASTALSAGPSGSSRPSAATTSGGRASPGTGDGKVDAEATGQLSLLGTESIVVDTSGGVREALLADDTLVLDAQGSVCAEGEIPHRCSSEQLAKALKAGISFYAKVSIGDGTAVRIEEIVRN